MCLSSTTPTIGSFPSLVLLFALLCVGLVLGDNTDCDMTGAVVQQVSNAASNFVKCLTENGSPVLYCEMCREEKLAWDHAFADMPKACQDYGVYKGMQDSLINATANSATSLGIWYASHCDGCSKVNFASYNQYLDNFYECIHNFIYLGGSDGDMICTNCSAEFEAVDTFHSKLSLDCRSNVDIVDKYRRMLSSWSFHDCTVVKVNKRVMYVVVTIATVIPVIFYLTVCFVGRKSMQQKELKALSASLELRNEFRERRDSDVSTYSLPAEAMIKTKKSKRAKGDQFKHLLSTTGSSTIASVSDVMSANNHYSTWSPIPSTTTSVQQAETTASLVPHLESLEVAADMHSLKKELKDQNSAKSHSKRGRLSSCDDLEHDYSAAHMYNTVKTKSPLGSAPSKHNRVADDEYDDDGMFTNFHQTRRKVLTDDDGDGVGNVNDSIVDDNNKVDFGNVMVQRVRGLGSYEDVEEVEEKGLANRQAYNIYDDDEDDEEEDDGNGEDDVENVENVEDGGDGRDGAKDEGDNERDTKGDALEPIDEGEVLQLIVDEQSADGEDEIDEVEKDGEWLEAVKEHEEGEGIDDGEQSEDNDGSILEEEDVDVELTLKKDVGIED
eukprot:m.27257 g.27257  ORF g.27257 m.27257 type:complete len:611 (-) comp5925_c0_seq1:199-2031(-)